MTGLEDGRFDQIVTVFCAPDYFMRCGNQAGIMELDENYRKKEIRLDTPRNCVADNLDPLRYFALMNSERTRNYFLVENIFVHE
jgi:serine/threonine-protein phosphatase 2A catalytic subunit